MLYHITMHYITVYSSVPCRWTIEQQQEPQQRSDCLFVAAGPRLRPGHLSARELPEGTHRRREGKWTMHIVI